VNDDAGRFQRRRRKRRNGITASGGGRVRNHGDPSLSD
jgi:hypothetical protein